MTLKIRFRNVADGEALMRRASQHSADLSARHRFPEQIVSVEGFGPRAFEARLDLREPERQVIVSAGAPDPLQAIDAAFERASARLARAARRAG